MMNPPSFDHELRLEREVGGLVAGVDEVGRGPWAGPVIACAAAILDREVFGREFADVRDSKALTVTHREGLFGRLASCPYLVFHLGEASVEEIDSLNILQATLFAMRRALSGLSATLDKMDRSLGAYLVDGLHSPTAKWPGRALVKGDQLSASIATASVIAKVSRDRLMHQLAQDFPGYGWERNAGYGTRDHQEGLRLLGVTPYHRRSFAPIKKILGREETPLARASLFSAKESSLG